MSSNVLKLVDFAPEEALSPEARQLIDYTLKRAPKKITRQTIVEQFHETFQLIGGVPRLALWADQNPGAYFALYSKLLPAAIKAEMTLPQSLEGMSVDQMRELSVDQLKLLLLVKAGDLAEDAQVTYAPQGPQ